MKAYIDCKGFWHSHHQDGFRVARILATKGSTYKKAGSIKLVSRGGMGAGMLSGGCLEEEITRLTLSTPVGGSFEIDTRSPEDKFFGSGTGCQGLLKVEVTEVAANTAWPDFAGSYLGPLKVPHVNVIGAGGDVAPLVRLMKPMQWSFSCIDYRKKHIDNLLGDSPYCRQVSAGSIEKSLPLFLDPRFAGERESLFRHFFVLMSHNFEYDLEGLCAAAKSGAAYIGVLGPKRRRDEIVDKAKAKMPDLGFDWETVKGPMGIQGLGRGEEAIAVSILAEMVHAIAN